MKEAAGYLDYMQYYTSEAQLGLDDTTSTLDKLGRCQHVWWRERRGEDVRFRGIGCGERRYCPLCGSYSQLTLANEKAVEMLDAIFAVEKLGHLELESFGLKLVFTIPKDKSNEIDGMLWDDVAGWEIAVNGLFDLVSRRVKRWYGKDVCYLLSIDLTGESNPTEPHYHINAYIFPALLKREKGKVPGFTDVKRWRDRLALDEMRADWCGDLNTHYGLELAEADFQMRYLAKEASLRHWFQYMYRPVVADLWRGWDGYDGEIAKYHYMKDGHRIEVDLPRDDVTRAFKRVDYIPQHFKKTRWYGAFSDSQRAGTMESLLLERIETDQDQDGDDEWENDGVVHLVRFEKDGVVFWDPDTGWQFKVSSSLVNYRPRGCSVGRRVKWRRPVFSLDKKIVRPKAERRDAGPLDIGGVVAS